MAVLFDVDDTLLDTRAAMLAAGSDAVRAGWPHLSDDEAQAVAVHHRDDVEKWFPRYTTGELTLAEMRRGRLDAAAAAAGLRGSDGHAAFEEAYPRAFFAATRVFDDVPPALAALDEAGERLGLLTNASADFTDGKLEVAAIATRFHVTVTRDNLGYGKPDPRVFLHGCELLGSSPAETFYVGDELLVDAVGARDAGLRGVWLDRRRRWDGRDVGVPVISSLAELVDLVAASR